MSRPTSSNYVSADKDQINEDENLNAPNPTSSPNIPNPSSSRNAPNSSPSRNAPKAVEKFCKQTNFGVFTCSAVAGISFYVANIEKSSSSSAPTLPFAAGACGFGFLGSSLGIFLSNGGKHIKLVKFFTIVGVTGLFDMVVISLMDICLSGCAIWIGAMTSILPICYLGERLIGLSARLLACIDCIKTAFALLRRIRRT